MAKSAAQAARERVLHRAGARVERAAEDAVGDEIRQRAAQRTHRGATEHGGGAVDRAQAELLPQPGLGVEATARDGGRRRARGTTRQRSRGHLQRQRSTGARREGQGGARGECPRDARGHPRHAVHGVAVAVEIAGAVVDERHHLRVLLGRDDAVGAGLGQRVLGAGDGVVEPRALLGEQDPVHQHARGAVPGAAPELLAQRREAADGLLEIGRRPGQRVLDAQAIEAVGPVRERVLERGAVLRGVALRGLGACSRCALAEQGQYSRGVFARRVQLGGQREAARVEQLAERARAVRRQRVAVERGAVQLGVLRADGLTLGGRGPREQRVERVHHVEAGVAGEHAAQAHRAQRGVVTLEGGAGLSGLERRQLRAQRVAQLGAILLGVGGGQLGPAAAEHAQQDAVLDLARLAGQQLGHQVGVGGRGVAPQQSLRPRPCGAREGLLEPRREAVAGVLAVGVGERAAPPGVGRALQDLEHRAAIFA
jgi:hypothetical protein